MIERDLKKTIKKWLFKGKVITLYGARQVGKTTLARILLKEQGSEKHYYDCELVQIRQLLERKDLSEMTSFFGNAKLIVLDEAQKVDDIGVILKILHDHLPKMQIIATGSSSFVLSNRLQEPLTGRGVEFTLYPFSLGEQACDKNKIEREALLKETLVYGSYPEIFLSGMTEKRLLLDNLANKYLFNNLFELEKIKRPDVLAKLLQMLAFQIGNEVSRNELSIGLGVNRDTINRYLHLLESAFIIFRLQSLSRNLRKELTKKEKYYFYDLGIRNSIIGNLNSIDLRNDIGALWENFCMVERMKYRQKRGIYGNRYFWRTYDQQEIDLVEERGGKMYAYEFKWKEKTWRVPKPFREEYEVSDSKLVTPKNYEKFLM